MQVAGLPLQAVEIDVADLLRNDRPMMDLEDLRSVVTWSGVSPEQFELTKGAATYAAGATVTIRGAGTLGSPAAGDQASSRAVLLADAVYLITSADPALLAAAP